MAWVTNNKTTSVSRSTSTWRQITLLLVRNCILHPCAPSFVLKCCFFHQLFIFFLLHFVNLFGNASVNPFISDRHPCLLCHLLNLLDEIFEVFKWWIFQIFVEILRSMLMFPAMFSIVYFLQSSILSQAGLYLYSSCFKVTGIFQNYTKTFHKKITNWTAFHTKAHTHYTDV